MSAFDACVHAPNASAATRFEVADVVRRHGASFRREHVLTPAQHEVLNAIERCRTASLGGHVELCMDCDHRRISYNSCRNRHCPKCQALQQARWIAKRTERLLPISYFHVVFTLPAELRRIAQHNRRLVFDILFKSAAQTLLELGFDPKRLGGRLGVTAVLHTWSRELWFHPHLHCIVTGGGLTLDAAQWVAARGQDYLLPVKVLGALFRGKMLAALKAAYRGGNLNMPDTKGDGNNDEPVDPECFNRMVSALYRKSWVVYAKRPFGGPEQVLRYLGRYTHRVGLSNHRIRSVTDDDVTFATKTGKTVTVHPHEFLRRLLEHVLPKRFVKIRHYGLLAPQHATTSLEIARQLLTDTDGMSSGAMLSTNTHPPGDAAVTWQVLLHRLTGVDLGRCPACGSANLVNHALDTTARAPPRGSTSP